MQAFDLFDANHDGFLSPEELRGVLKSVDVTYEDSEWQRNLSRMQRTLKIDAGERAKKGFSLHNVTQLMRDQSYVAIEQGRYFVALSLAEAQTVRAPCAHRSQGVIALHWKAVDQASA